MSLFNETEKILETSLSYAFDETGCFKNVNGRSYSYDEATEKLATTLKTCKNIGIKNFKWTDIFYNCQITECEIVILTCKCET